MPQMSNATRGILLMVVATAIFVANDVFYKIALEGLPPFQTLAMRGAAAAIWSLPLLAVTGNLGHLPKAFNPIIVRRNGFDLLAGLLYVIGLKHASLPHILALTQLSPIVMVLAGACFFGLRVSRIEQLLIVLACAGAMMVAQPGLDDFSPYALLGLLVAVCVAGRDLVGRTAPADVPGLVVAWGTGFWVTLGAGAATITFETLVEPNLLQISMIAGSALCLTFGHVLLFTSYKIADVGTVAPFFYCLTLWGLIGGWLFFGVVPNGLALAGIALILLSGAVIASRNLRRR